MKSITLCFALLVVLPGFMSFRITTNLEDELYSFAADALGVVQFQEYLHQNVTFQTTPLDGDGILEKVSKVMEDKYHKRTVLLEDLAQEMAESYTDIARQIPFMDCCDENAVYPVFDEQLRLYIDPDRICVKGTASKNSNIDFVHQSIVYFWRKKFNENHRLGIQWIYYGSEDGVMYNYPAVNQCDPDYDPRFRPFYIETVTPIPKDLVIVIDISGSMREMHNGRTLLSIAVEAAITVIDTLNINDRVGIVAFSDNTISPPGCYANEIARATADNKNRLKSFLSGLMHGSGTQYRKALRAAFALIQNTPEVQFDVRDRSKVILFLTDGRPSDCASPSNVSSPGYGYKCGYIYEDIRNMNAKLNNSVIILTYGLGESIDVAAVLENITKQVIYDEQYGNVTHGIYDHVENPDNLRKRMASYYDMFIKKDNSPGVHFTVPYQDVFGSGMIASMCRPVHVATHLEGVICVDEAVHDLLSELLYVQVGKSSYAFMADIYSRVLSHPYTAFEVEVTNHPKFTFLATLEKENGTDEAIETMITSIINGESNNITAVSEKIISGGDAILDGVYTSSRITYYSWRQVAYTKYVIGVAIENGDTQARITWNGHLQQDFLYHKLKTQAESGSIAPCSHLSTVSVKDMMSVYFASRAVIDPYAFIFEKEDSVAINAYAAYFTSLDVSDPGIFKEQIREYVSATAHFQEVLLRTLDDYNHITMWRYLATENGIFRIFPAAELPKLYDPTKRLWYTQAKAYPDWFIITRPYAPVDDDTLLITLARAVTHGKSDGERRATGNAVIGVMGMDFSPFYLYRLMNESITYCATYTCFLVDKSGFIVTHPDWMEQPITSSQMLNVHIARKEPYIASKLLVELTEIQYETCINIFELRHQFSWRLQYLSDYYAEDFEIHAIEGTNLFLVIKTKRFPDMSMQTQCSSCVFENYTECNMNLDSNACFCPCFKKNSTHYSFCKDVFQLSGDDYPICLPPLPQVNFSVVEKVSNLVSPCYRFDCTSQKTVSECRSYWACEWCIHQNRSDDVCDRSRVPSCSSRDQCASDQTQYNPDSCVEEQSTTVKAIDSRSTTATGRIKSSSTQNDSSDNSEDTPGWAIGLIVVAVLLIVVIIIAVVLGLVVMRPKQNKHDDGVRNFADFYEMLSRVARRSDQVPCGSTPPSLGYIAPACENPRQSAHYEDSHGCNDTSFHTYAEPHVSVPASEGEQCGGDVEMPNGRRVTGYSHAEPRCCFQTPDVALQALHGRGSAVNISSEYITAP